MKNKIWYLPKFQNPAGPLPDFSDLPASEQFKIRQESPLFKFVQTINSEQGKQNRNYSGNYYYVKNDEHPQGDWIFIRSEEPLKPMEQDIAEYLPGIGDAAEVANISKDISQGNIGQALLAAGLLILPGNASRIIRKTRNDAVDMFRTYNKNHTINIPENSKLYPEIQKLIPEARKRYELTNNMDITDEEIAKALYGRANKLGFETAAKYSTGEPHLLFRGDTKRYEQLRERLTPAEVAERRGTMDNSLGNLFLGKFPDSFQGIDRYIGTYNTWFNSINGSGTGSRVRLPNGKVIQNIDWDFETDGILPWRMQKLYDFKDHSGNSHTIFKLPDEVMESGVNDINPFIVKTPKVRDSTLEISVLDDDRLPFGLKRKDGKLQYNYLGGSRNARFGRNFDGFFEEPEFRQNVTAPHYTELLKRAEQKNQGLLFSSGANKQHPLREEHGQYDYFVLPNFNRTGAKHLFSYDINQPVRWDIDNIYLKEGGILDETETAWRSYFDCRKSD